MSRNVGRKALFEALKKGQDRIAKGHVTRNLHYPEPKKKPRTDNTAGKIVEANIKNNTTKIIAKIVQLIPSALLIFMLYI